VEIEGEEEGEEGVSTTLACWVRRRRRERGQVTPLLLDEEEEEEKEEEEDEEEEEEERRAIAFSIPDSSTILYLSTSSFIFSSNFLSNSPSGTTPKRAKDDKN